MQLFLIVWIFMKEMDAPISTAISFSPFNLKYMGYFNQQLTKMVDCKGFLGVK